MSEKFFSRYGWFLFYIILFGFLTIWSLELDGFWFKLCGIEFLITEIAIIIFSIWYSLKYRCPHCKKGNALKRGKKLLIMVLLKKKL